MHERKGDETFGEFEFSVTREQVQEFRKKMLDEMKQNSGAYHAADEKRIEENDEFCRRFVRHKKLVMDDAIAMAKSALQWRHSFGVNELNESIFPEQFFTASALYPYNIDKFGSHIMMLQVKNHKKNSAHITEMKKFITYFVEKIFHEIGGIRITFIFDCHDAGISNVDLELIKFIINIFKEYYPWGLGYIIVYDMPWLLNAAWKLIKSWLPQEGIDRIKFTNKTTILEYVEKDKLPTKMGGTDTYEYDYKPGEGLGKRCSNICYATVPLK